MKAGIVGAGHAGLAAAELLADAGVQVKIFSAENVLPYYRPRVVPLAFDLAADESLPIHAREWYREKNIELLLDEKVVCCGGMDLSLATKSSRESFDVLIIASGAEPIMPPWGFEIDRVVPMWKCGHARFIREQLPKCRRIAILGGGITGVESAVYARKIGLETILVEKCERLMPLHLGPRSAEALSHRLAELGVEVFIGSTVSHVEWANEKLLIDVEGVREIACDLLITSIGGRPDLAPYAESGIKLTKSMVVDDRLSTSVPGIFACGDAVQLEHGRGGNLRSAIRQGRVAAENALAFLRGGHLKSYTPEPAGLSFKYEDMLELHCAGCPPACAEQEEILQNTDGVFHSVYRYNGDLQGVFFLGDRKGFRQLTDELRC